MVDCVIHEQNNKTKQKQKSSYRLTALLFRISCGPKEQFLFNLLQSQFHKCNVCWFSNYRAPPHDKRGSFQMPIHSNITNQLIIQNLTISKSIFSLLSLIYNNQLLASCF